MYIPINLNSVLVLWSFGCIFFAMVLSFSVGQRIISKYNCYWMSLLHDFFWFLNDRADSFQMECLSQWCESHWSVPCPIMTTSMSAPLQHRSRIFIPTYSSKKRKSRQMSRFQILFFAQYLVNTRNHLFCTLMVFRQMLHQNLAVTFAIPEISTECNLFPCFSNDIMFWRI